MTASNLDNFRFEMVIQNRKQKKMHKYRQLMAAKRDGIGDGQNA